MFKKIIPIIDLEGWTIMEEEADVVYISWDEIWKIYNVDLSESPHLEDYRNDVVLGCLTGLRFSDFSQLVETDVRGDLLYKKQQKSNHWVVIPLRPEAKKILENRFQKGVKHKRIRNLNAILKQLRSWPVSHNLSLIHIKKEISELLKQNRNMSGLHRIPADGLFVPMSFWRECRRS